MAAIQTIRSWGAVLASIVGLALFAFVAEEAVRSMSSQSNEKHQQVGTICGENISYQDFQALVSEQEDIFMMMRGTTNLSDEERAYVRNQVWQQHVEQVIIANECEKLGLSVTDAEVQDALVAGTSPILRNTPFTNQQTGAFDVASLKQFIENYKQLTANAAQVDPSVLNQYESTMKYWRYIEKSLRPALLASKYQSLLQSSIISNKISAKAAFDARQEQATVLLTALPYSSMKDDEAGEVTDKEIKAAYDKIREGYYQDIETRTISMISVPVTASQADKDALLADMNEAAAALAVTENFAKTVRENGSTIPYSTMPVKKSVLPGDLALAIDTLTVGSVTGPFTSGNAMNVIRLMAKSEMPDSIEFRIIEAGGNTAAASRKSADSIVAAIKAGAPFDTIAARYNQQGAKMWMTGQQFEGVTLDADQTKYIKAIATNPTGTLDVLEIGDRCLVYNVTDRRNPQTKYDVAIVRRDITFSRDTYTEEYNKFSQFLAENQTAAAIRENAEKKGYNLIEVNVQPTDHTVGNVNSTRDALRWIFNEDTEKEDVSPLYECGDNDNLLVAILNDIVPEGYMTLDNSEVKANATALAIQDKKAALFTQQMQGKTAAEAKSLKGAVSDTVTYITFDREANVISLTGRMESAICGAVAGLAKGQSTSPVKGNGGVYVATVINTNQAKGTYNEEAELSTAASTLMQNLRYFRTDLHRKAQITDRRYLFY